MWRALQVCSVSAVRPFLGVTGGVVSPVKSWSAESNQLYFTSRAYRELSSGGALAICLTTHTNSDSIPYLICVWVPRPLEV